MLLWQMTEADYVNPPYNALENLKGTLRSQKLSLFVAVGGGIFLAV